MGSYAFNLANVALTASPSSNATVTYFSGNLQAQSIDVQGAFAPANGLYEPANNVLGFTTNATEQARITAMGNLLIGGTTAASGANTRVLVNSIGTNGGGLQLAGGTAGGTTLSALNGGGLVLGTYSGAVGSETYTERMRIDNNGNVGIATSSITAGYKLQVNGVISDNAGNLRDIVNNAQGGAYILTLADNGKMINITTGGVTVNAGIFSAGNNITIVNNSAASQTITQGAVTIYLAGTATTGNRTLAQRGVATILCIAANTFIISGAGLS